MRKRALWIPALAAFLAILSAPSLSAANIVVESLELVSYGRVDQATGDFPVTSRLAFDMTIGGGEKFTGLLRLDFLSTRVEDDLEALARTLGYGDPTLWTPAERDSLLDRLNAPGLRLKTVAVTAKRIFGLPVDAAYFVGYLDTFCSGDDFTTLFGAFPFATELRGPLRYPGGIALNPTVSWNGIHSVSGTGARFGFSPSDTSRVYGYVYQSADLGAGHWSVDLRGLVDFGELKLESFAGATFNYSYPLGKYRGGLLFFAAPGDIGEFYAQVGVPFWDPHSPFNVNDVFFLFEPRVTFGGTSQLALSVFYHPAFYQQKPTGEGGSLDVGFNLRFGRLAETGAQGGAEMYLQFRPLESNPLTATFAPYYEGILTGVAWSFKLNVAFFPFPATWLGMFTPFVGVKTSF